MGKIHYISIKISEMNFERNKGVLVTLDAGRSQNSFVVKETWVCVVTLGENSDPSKANIGRYFKAPNSQDFQVISETEYEFLYNVLNDRKDDLEKMMNSFLKKYSSKETLLFVFKFVGESWEESEARKKDPLLFGKLKSYYFSDLYGKDLKFENGKFLQLPLSRMLANSDFQLHMKGTG